MTRATASLPPCPRCAVLAPAVARADVRADDFETLSDAASLASRFADRAVEQDVRHRMSADDVIALYELSETIACSMAGGHAHRDGLVVRTACGLVLFLGKDCGAASVEGFVAGQVFVRRTRAHHSRLRLSERLPELDRQVIATASKLRPLFALLRTISEEHPDLARDARERARLGARGLEVDSDVRVRRDGREDWARDRRRLSGMEIWEGTHTDAKLLDLRRDVARLKAALDADPTPRTLAKLSTRFDEIERIRIKNDRLWEAAAAYFAQENLTWAVRAAHPSRQRDPDWVRGRTRAIGELYDRALRGARSDAPERTR